VVNLVRVFKVPCNKYFLFWHYWLFCTKNESPTSIWSCPDNFVLPWLVKDHSLRVQDLQVPFRSAQEMRNKSKENSRWEDWHNTRMRRLAPVIEANKVLYIRHLKCLNKLLPSCSTLSVQPTCLLGSSQRSLSVRLCCKNKTDDHRELNYLTGVTNTMCSKHYYYTLPLL